MGRVGLHLQGAVDRDLDEILRACGLAPAYVGPQENGWISVYPTSFDGSDDGGIEQRAVDLSRLSGGRVVGTWLHRALGYVLAERGTLIDTHGLPGSGHGEVERLLSFCAPSARREAVEALLRFQAPPTAQRPGPNPAQQKLLQDVQAAFLAGQDPAPEVFERLQQIAILGGPRAAQGPDIDAELATQLSSLLGVKKERLLQRVELIPFVENDGLRLVRVVVPEPVGLPPLRSFDGPMSVILEQLEARLGDRLAKLEPGLPEDELRQLEQLLFPFSLPEDWRAFYRWRNGTLGEALELPLHANLFSLETALEQRKFFVDKLEWNPMWLPIADGSRGAKSVFAISLHQGQFQPPFVWEIWFEDGHFVLRHESLPKMLACGLDQVERVPSEELVGYQDWNDRAEALRLLHSPSADVEDQEPPSWPRRIDVGEDRQWPAAWQRAIGRGSESYRSTGATTTIARIREKVGLGDRGTIEARIVFLIGQMDEAAIRVEDGTGDLWLHCKGDACRDIRLDAVCEIDVRAIEYLRALHTDLYYRATRLLRLDDEVGD